jgi:hypothetical protein
LIQDSVPSSFAVEVVPCLQHVLDETLWAHSSLRVVSYVSCGGMFYGHYGDMKSPRIGPRHQAWDMLASYISLRIVSFVDCGPQIFDGHVKNPK